MGEKDLMDDLKRSPLEAAAWGVLALLLLLTLIGAVRLDRSKLPLLGDEATYAMQASSLVHDFDLTYTRKDYDRFVAQWGVPPEGLILQSRPGSDRLTYGKPPLYALLLAPFVAASPVRGPVVANALLLAAAALLAVALVPAWMERREIESLRSGLASTERLTGELQQARRDLSAETAKREALAREVEAARQPQANLPVVPLTPVRGGNGPARTLKLPAKPGWVGLWIEPGDADFPAYRATLRKNDGAAVFQASPLALNDLGALLITAHSASLSPGSYLLEVEGLPRSGAPVSLDRFPLRVE